VLCAKDGEESFVFEMAAQPNHAMIGFVIRLSSLAILLFRLIPRYKPLHGSGFVAMMEELSDR